MLETCTITPQLTHKHSYIHPEFEKSTLMVIICIVEKKEQKHHKQIYETYEKNIYFLLNVKLYTYSLYSCKVLVKDDMVFLKISLSTLHSTHLLLERPMEATKSERRVVGTLETK